MRYLSILAICFFAFSATTSVQAQDDAISKYFSKYVDDDRFTTVFISPKMFELVQTMDIETSLDEDEHAAIKEVVQNMKSIRILTSESDGKSLYQEAAKNIPTNEYEVLMTVKDKDASNVQFLVKDSANGKGLINELLLLVGGNDEDFVLMSFIGDIDLSKIGKLAKAFEED